MAWFLNYYTCARCGRDWTDEWSCMCDDDCPHCGARHMSPAKSDDLTDIIARSDEGYVVLRSPQTAEHSASYRRLASFRTLEEADAYLDTP
jgi:DNA-directed RNA polymerase subunit RPC12/RpoP